MNIRHRPRLQAAIVTIAALVAVTLGASAPAEAADGTILLSGTVWDDSNSNGHQDDGEPGIPDLQLAVFDPDMTPILDPADESAPLFATTDTRGTYTFASLPALQDGQHYTVFLFAPEGYASTTGLEQLEGGYVRPTSSPLSTPDASETGIDFAITKPTTVRVGGTVWNDQDHDGQKDAGEAGLADLQAAIFDPDMNPVLDPADESAPLFATTDGSGAYSFPNLPVLQADQHYTVYLFSPDGYASTTGLERLENGYTRPTTADLTTPGTSDTAVDFPLATGDADPGDGGDPGDGSDPGDGGEDWLVMPNWHGDLLYPEIDSTGDGAQELEMRAHIDTYEPMDWNDLIVYHSDVTKESLPDHYTPDADYSFIGQPGSTVYRSGLTSKAGDPWIGAATQSPTLDVFQPDHPFSFRLDAVTGYDGGTAPGDVVLWQSEAPQTGHTLFSTVKGLPQALVFGKGKHTHFNWSFTQPGIYCMAFSVQTDMPDGSRQQARGILTQIVGSQFDPHTIEPCGRHLTYPNQPTKAVIAGTDPAPVVSGDGNADFSLTLDDQQKLHATYDQEPTYGDGPSTSHTIDNVILYAKAGLDYPYRFTHDDRGMRNISWDTVQIGDSALDGNITWSIDSLRGPGDLSFTNAGEWGDQRFDTASGSLSQTLWAGSAGNWRTPKWQVTRPGKYCVAMTWTAKTADGKTVSDHHVLTLVAEGPLDPDDYDPYDESGKDGPYAGEVWRAADHGALDKTCAQGAQPTSADEVPVPDPGDGSDNPPVDDSAWKVPNWSKTDSGALILNNGHIDIASTLDGGTFDTQIKDTTNEGQINATHDGASWHDPAKTVLQLLPDAETAVPAGDAYRFLGQAGRPVWIVSETQQPDLLWPGWSTETIPVAATQTGVRWTLDKMSGPGEFALYKGGQTLGSVDVVYNTRDGITAADSIDIAKNAHVHGSWAFSAEGTYCLAFTRSTTLTDGTKASDDFTLAVAVGKVDVKRIDPSACFSTTGKPDTQDITPVPEGQLTNATQGGVQVLDSEAGFYPGQLVTLQVGKSHAGQWVSTWLHPQPTWLGWAQVNNAGAVQVRLPADAALGAHKIVVKTQAGELIGWDALAMIKAPDDGNGDDGDGDGGPTNPVCTAGDTTIISAGHLDYSTQIVNGKIESYIGDNSSGTEVFREPSKTVLWLKPSSTVTLPAGYEQVGPEGSRVFMVPQTQNMELIWLGWSTETLNSSKVSTPVTWKLTNVDGPGSVKVFLDGQFGGIQSMVFDGTGSYDIRTGVHAHANWAFSKAGIYKLHFTQTATLTGGGSSSDSEVVTIAVGDVDPVSAVPGGKDCVGDDGGHHGDGGDGAGDGGTGGQQGDGGQAPASQAAAQCTSTGVTVISAGHLDWNTQVIGGKLESLIGDDSTGSRLYRNPGSTVLWLKPGSQVSLPSGFSQVGPAGSTVWQVPQTQNYDLIWLGWSTELLNAGNASSPVTWSLTQVDGPGSVKVYTVGSFGSLQEMVFNGTSSHTIPLGVHVHANWAFSAQGVYHLHFTQTATLANGQRSSDSEVLTVAVGDVNPNTALAKGPGCGAISNALLNGNQNLDAAKQAAAQAQADAARAQAGVMPGGSNAGAGAVDPITALTQGNPVPLLLSVLGALLLLGGAGVGVLWWRRRKWEGVTAQAPAGS